MLKALPKRPLLGAFLIPPALPVVLISGKSHLIVLIPLIACLNGCILGPGSLQHNRGGYNRAVQRTAREEMLLNLVRMRYNQSTDWVTISSITHQNTFDAAIGGSGSWREKVPTALGSTLGFSAQEKPTLGLTPEQGKEFNQRLLSPISGDTLDLVSSKGWSIERFLRLMTRNVNGVDNATPAGGPMPSVKPQYEQFRAFTIAMRQLQVHYPGSFEVVYKEVVTKPTAQLQDPIPVDQVSAVALNEAQEKGNRYHVDADRKYATLWRYEVKEKVKVLLFREDVRGTSDFLVVCQVLGLDPAAEYYRIQGDRDRQIPGQHINSGGTSEDLRNEIVISHRSLKEAMYYLSQVIEVPDSHIEDGIAQQTMDETGCPFDWKDVMGDLFQVHHNRLRPRKAAVSVWYKGRWFYIDDRDNSSKSTFNLLLEMFNLEIRAVGASQGPLLTIS